MHQNILEDGSVIKNGAWSWFGRPNLTLSFFGFFSSHLKLFYLFFELLCKFKCFHKILTVFKTLRCFLCSSSSFYLKNLIFREGINLVCFSDINLSKFLFCFFEHKFFFSLLSLLVNEYLFLSLSPHSDTLISRYSHKEIPYA